MKSNKNVIRKIVVCALAIISFLTAVWMDSSPAEAADSNRTVKFGSYPQSRVSDAGLITNLNLSVDGMHWKTYNYYTGDGKNFGSMHRDDIMQYIDMSYNGEKYRGVRIMAYRPRTTCTNSSETTSNQKDNGYTLTNSTNDCYWFKYEPLEWQIVDSENGLMMTKQIIDAQEFHHNLYYNIEGNKAYNDSAHTTDSSDYKTSTVRTYLNKEFYKTAFSRNERVQISYVKNENKSPSNKAFVWESTKDNVFLPSYEQAKSMGNDGDRIAKGTDYAKCQGLEIQSSGNSAWYTRSPSNYSGQLTAVESTGNIDTSSGIGSYQPEGIRPMISISKSGDVQNMDIRNMDVPFRNTTLTLQWGFDLFSKSSTKYHNDLAKLSLILSDAAEKEQQGSIEELLKHMGFASDDLDSKHYGHTWDDFLFPAYTFGYHRVSVDGKTKNVFVLVVRGTNADEGEDIATDIIDGCDGLKYSVNLMYSNFKKFAEERTGKDFSDLKQQDNIIWITGHSLGGGIANRLSVNFEEFTPESNVYCYTFAAIQPFKTQKNKPNVFNVLNQEDIITGLPTNAKLLLPTSPFDKVYFRAGNDMWFSPKENEEAFYTNYKKITGKDQISQEMLAQHDTAVYMSYLLSR